MAYSSDSSSEEDLQDSISRVLKEEDITRTAWLGDWSPRNEVKEDSDDSCVDAGPIKEPAVKVASRAYQLEMLDASLKENVIVAMDTGSGKTQV